MKNKYLITTVNAGYDYNDINTETVELENDRVKEYVETEFRSLLQEICEEEHDEENYAVITEEEEPGKYSIKAHIDFEMGHEYIYDICVMAVKSR